MISAVAVHSKGIHLGKISSISKSRLFFTLPVCHEAGIWTIDPSVSACIEVVLSEVELWNMKLRNLWYLYLEMCSDTRTMKHMFCSPLTPRILSYTVNLLTGGTRQKQLACLSVLVIQMWPSFSPGTRSDHVYRSCFHTGLWACFMSVLTWSTFSLFMFYTRFTLSDQSV